MTDIVKGMARVAFKAQYGADFDPLQDGVREEFMRAALLWLADNVSDEMTSEFWHTFYREGVSTAEAFSAAIRAAAGGGE
jgi:hypothetical protein